MSTISAPRDPSLTSARRTPLITTPSSSARPSIELPRSGNSSPAPIQQPKRANRAALREYYNLKASQNANPSPNQDTLSETSSIHDNNSDVTISELDAVNFDAERYIKKVLEEQSLGELLRTYNGVLTDIRSLDAEKKALVYDNYSKLIAATETIRRMRGEMGKKGGTEVEGLDGRIRNVWDKAEAVKKSWSGEGLVKGGAEAERKKKRRETVLRVLETPGRVREAVAEGREEDAARLWESTKRVLERWRERGVGGSDVGDCIEDGDAALSGEGPGEKSWVNKKKES